jgi:hypothetical protein
MLLGPLNWWAPKPLRRLYERAGLQESALAAAPDPRPLPTPGAS